jgi:hypothetical protein
MPVNFPLPKHQLTPWHHNFKAANHTKFEEVLEKMKANVGKISQLG